MPATTAGGLLAGTPGLPPGLVPPRCGGPPQRRRARRYAARSVTPAASACRSRSPSTRGRPPSARHPPPGPSDRLEEGDRCRLGGERPQGLPLALDHGVPVVVPGGRHRHQAEVPHCRSVRPCACIVAPHRPRGTYRKRTPPAPGVKAGPAGEARGRRGPPAPPGGPAGGSRVPAAAGTRPGSRLPAPGAGGLWAPRWPADVGSVGWNTSIGTRCRIGAS